MPGVGGGGPREGPPALYWAGPHPAHPLGGGGGLQPKAHPSGHRPEGLAGDWAALGCATLCHGQHRAVPWAGLGCGTLCHGQGWDVPRAAPGCATLCHEQSLGTQDGQRWSHTMGSIGAMP